jgi:hypothetical protein
LNGTTENELECMEEKAIKAHVKGLQNPWPPRRIRSLEAMRSVNSRWTNLIWYGISGDKERGQYTTKP